jgi:hypothetical protein
VFLKLAGVVRDRGWSSDLARSVAQRPYGSGLKQLRPFSSTNLDGGLPNKITEEHKNMPLINLVITLIVIGMALWVINRFIPMAGSIKTILNVVVVVAVGVWVLQSTGLWGPISSYRLPH